MNTIKNRLKKLEEKAQSKYIPNQIIIHYRKPSGEIIKLACQNSLCVIPSDEKENVVKIEGSRIDVPIVTIQKYGASPTDKKLYEQKGFIILPD